MVTYPAVLIDYIIDILRHETTLEYLKTRR